MQNEWREEMVRRANKLAVFTGKNSLENNRLIDIELEMCSRDFMYWAKNYAWIASPKEDPLYRFHPFIPWPKQVELIEWIFEKIRNNEIGIICKGRELGVSWTLLFIIWWSQRFQNGFIAKVGSRKEQLVDNKTLDSLFGKLRFINVRQPFFLRSEFVDKLLFLKNKSTDSEITGESTNAGFTRGGRGSLMVLDEFAHVEPSLQAQVWRSIDSVAGCTIALSSPNGPGNKFAELFNNLPKRNVFVLDWTANPKRDYVWFDNLLIINGGKLTEEERAQEHEAKIVSTSVGKIYVMRRSTVEYDESSKDWLDVREEALSSFSIAAGWDFGSGESLLACLLALVEIPEDSDSPRLWIDYEASWRSASWMMASADVKKKCEWYLSHSKSRFRGHVHFGDPAGTARESSQESWQSNLRKGGIPIFCLPFSYNERDQMEFGFKTVNSMAANGNLRIRSSCSYLIDCVENWRRNLPDGIQIDHSSKSYIAPRHDVYSHGGMALYYLIQGVMASFKAGSVKLDRRRIEKEVAKVIPTNEAVKIVKRLPSVSLSGGQVEDNKKSTSFVQDLREVTRKISGLF